MERNLMRSLAILVLVLFFGSGIVSALQPEFGGSLGSSASFTNPAAYQSPFTTYYSSEDIRNYWPILDDKESCQARQDFILRVAPGGCQPAVVRSDLLAEQNVPVFCQIDAIKLNPLIEVKEINYIRFTSQYPKEVAGTGFHPARAALKTRDKLLGSPLINNIGYAVVVLKKNEKESTLPEFVNVTLSGKIQYDSGNALGIGKAEFILSQQSDDEWNTEKVRQSFWNGRYFVRLERAEPEFVDVSIYQGDRRVSTVRATRGTDSNKIYLPGFYCQAALQVAYDGFVAAERSAKIEVSNDKGTEVSQVYRGSRILNDKCIVERIDLDATNNKTGSVSINCGYSQRILLQLKNLTLLNQNFQVGFQVGEEVIYKDDLHAVVSEALPDGSYAINIAGGTPSIAQAGELKHITSSKPQDRTYSAEMDKAFSEAVKSYEEITDNYPFEKIRDIPGDESYGEKALFAAVKMAQSYGKAETEARLINKFVDLYPYSVNIDDLKRRLQQIYSIDTSLSGNVVYVDGSYRAIRLVEIHEPERKASADFIIGNTPIPVNVGLRDTTDISYRSQGTKAKAIGRMTLNYLSIDEARITAFCTGDDKNEKREDHIFRLHDSEKQICGQPVVLDKINLEERAKIRLIPYAAKTESEINLTVRVGIEKRSIQLAPDKTREMISNINESIKKWDSISSSLGKVVTGLKGACFATSAVLTAKTFLTGLSGEGTARQMVMRGEKGWNYKCNEMISRAEKGYTNLNQCFLGEADNINKDVSATSNAINSINTKIKSIEDPLKKSNGLLGGSSIDRTSSANQYTEDLLNRHGADLVPNSEGKLVALSSLISKDGYSKGEFSYDQLKQYDLYLTLQKEQGSDVLRGNAESETKKTSEQIARNKELLQEVANAGKLREKGYAAPTSVISSNQRKIYADVIEVDKISVDSVKTELKKDSAVMYTSTLPVNSIDLGNKGKFDSGIYVLGLEKVGTEYNVKKIVIVDQNGALSKVLLDEEARKFNSVYNIGPIVSQNSVKYTNKYKNPEVRYYETEPYKGMPAMVPFDTLRGWYAATKQNLPVFNGVGGFESSGRVSSFWLCNVGENGIAQFEEGLGDDICQLINLNTGQPLNKFPGLEDREAERFVGLAVQALTDAANQYGNKVVRINGETFVVGKPALNIPATQCQDFMNPKDCHLLFNVCDPVICPSSRCDFGGKYPVADVVQTGVVGSTLLCLPNIKEKIAIPICLTGIHAGIDGYVSILKNHRDCLQESLDNGRTVGICDQIYSIYACEFFWRQVAPVANVLLPKLVEAAYGQGTRGGGEYLTVMGAWQNTKKSVDYFTSVYAVNSIKAFQIRSIEEAGTPFCKAFVSAKAPSSFKSLIEPDSPPQFNAWFSSTRFTTATVPATAQYKVFYHIFAGKDSGIYYRVYLKNPPESSYYYSASILHVSSGFVARGEYASQTRDFTAPEGYKELCVDINGEEKCGFKEVSTSFAVNYLRDQYVSDKIGERDITSEKECISGQASLGALLANSNPGAAAEEAALPQDYNRGIIRICASENPGSSTDPTRFAEVGICGDSKIKCWLDKNSVKNAITENNKYLQNKTLSEVEGIQKKVLEDRNLILSDNDANVKIDQLKTEVDFITAPGYEGAESVDSLKNAVDQELNKIDGDFGYKLDMLFFNHHKAEVLLLKARLKKAIVDAYLRNIPSTSSTSNQQISSVNSQGAGSKGIVSSNKWTLDLAIEEVKKRSGTYSDNKGFIDELYNSGKNGLITEVEYAEISGKGLLNREKDMTYVRDLLLKKKLATQESDINFGEGYDVPN